MHGTSPELLQSGPLWNACKIVIESSAAVIVLSTLFVDVNLATDGHPSKPTLKNGIRQLAFCTAQTQPNSFQLFSGANSFASA